MPESLFKESCRNSACNFIKNETLAQLFSFKFWEISKNTFFTEHFRATASESNPLIPVYVISRYLETLGLVKDLNSANYHII